MKNILILVSLLLYPNTIPYNELDSLLLELELNMKKRTEYDNAKELRIDNLKKLSAEDGITLKNKYFLFSKIITEYEKYSFDNALFYIENNIKIAKELDDDFLEKESKLILAKLLVKSGRYKESIDVLNKIDRMSLSKNLFDEYYYNFKEAYSGLSFYTTVTDSKKNYSILYKAYQDSLLQKLGPNSDESLALKEKELRDKREIKEALKINFKRLSQVEKGTPLYSLVTFERALLYQLNNNTNEQKKFLILSAISDIQTSIKDNASLTDLAMLFFKEGDIDRAHDYINFSVADADFYNSTLRFVNISNKLSVISKAFEVRSLEQKSKLKNLLIFISLLVLVLLITLYLIYKQIRKISTARLNLKEANEQLKDLNKQYGLANSDLSRLYTELSNSDKIKEHYIGTFLNLSSEYIEKLDVYRKTVRKYIITNKTKDLLEHVKSKKVVDDELKIFYSNFDKSFLHIYPNFIQNFNALLKEGERIVVKKDNTLNVELRIFALIRLGITNSSKISKILRYSVNTIYNYRVKVKNSAIEREEFENLVKKLT